MRIIYENLHSYHFGDATFRAKTVAVGMWQKRPINGFTWAPASQELCDEANKLNAAQKALRERQRAFNAKLDAAHKAHLQPATP